MFYNSMWGNCAGFGGHIAPEVMWSAYRKLFAVDLDALPEDAPDPVGGGMRPSLSPPPPASKGGPLEGGGLPKKEEEKIQEYLQRSDTAVIYPEPPPPASKDESKGGKYLLKCPHCDLSFSGGQAIHELKEHLALSHKEAVATDSNFTCLKCSATFTSRQGLNKHKTLHNTNGQQQAADEDYELRKFKCPHCGKAFKYKHHLIEHIRTHSGEKPFTCNHCGRKFSHSGSFSAHNTGKKCLLLNLKVRKVPRGRGNSSNNNSSTQNNSFRPIIPKYRPGGPTASPEMPLLPPAGFNLPSSDQFSSFSGGRSSRQPFLPISFHPLLAAQPHYPHLSHMGHFPEVTHLLQQRRYDNDSDHPAHLPSHEMAPSLDKLNESPSDSPGELKAVKKILEIVDATVTKQQKSPTKPRNGLLSELLSAAPALKSSPPPFDARCRYCSRHFDSRVDLHQHETYLCPQNGEATSPRHDSDGETRVSPTSLTVDCVLSLRAHYRTNPRPKKSEVIRLSRDLKCSARTVQDWFHSQQQQNGNRSPEPSRQFNGHPYQSPPPAPHFNGAIPNCNQVVPFRPIAEKSDAPLGDDQPLDLSVKISKPTFQEQNNNEPMLSDCESEVLNLSQRSSRTPPKVASPYQLVRHQDDASPQLNLHSSLLYKYMQIGISNNHHSSRDKSPAMERPSSPERSTERPHSMSSPGGVSYADNSSNPSATTGSYCHIDEQGDGTRRGVKRKALWNQGDCDETTLLDCPEEDSCSGKMRKSWKRHKVESEEGMYACDQCDKMFSKQSSLARHKYEHSGQRPHVCDLCSKAFKHKHHLTEHKRLHSGEKPFQCGRCHKRFSHSGSYSQHKNHRSGYCKPYHE